MRKVDPLQEHADLSPASNALSALQETAPFAAVRARSTERSTQAVFTHPGFPLAALSDLFGEEQEEILCSLYRNPTR